MTVALLQVGVKNQCGICKLDDDAENPPSNAATR